MTAPALMLIPPVHWEIVQTHPATCRVNLLCWDLTELEAARVLRELQDAQRARQGAILVGGRPEMGWTYLARQQGGVEAPSHVNGVAARMRRPTRNGVARR